MMRPVSLVHLCNLLQQLGRLLRSKVDMGEVLSSSAVFTRVIVTEQRLDGVGTKQRMCHE